MGLTGVHLILVFLWLGLVLAEVTIEAFALSRQFGEAVATFHYWIDTFFEIPLLMAIATTGIILASRLDTIDTLHAVKITAGLLTVLATPEACRIVRRRKEVFGDREQFKQCQREIQRTAYVAVPAGLVALVIGLTFAF
jgi:hypothetical protein